MIKELKVPTRHICRLFWRLVLGHCSVLLRVTLMYVILRARIPDCWFLQAEALAVKVAASPAAAGTPRVLVDISSRVIATIINIIRKIMIIIVIILIIIIFVIILSLSLSLFLAYVYEYIIKK
jgi:hypothetical protein